MNDIAYLVNEVLTEDDIGNSVSETSETAVFCEISSVGQSEFYKAAAVGYKPQCRLKMWENEYGGQSLVRIGNVYYSVIRNFTENGTTELYLEGRVGNK
nr:MAG TPA: head closure knob [Caudoviricetes sp.]